MTTKTDYIAPFNYNLTSRYHKKFITYQTYRKVPKFSDARKLRSKLPKIQTKGSNHRKFCPKNANGIANSEDPDQTAPLVAV